MATHDQMVIALDWLDAYTNVSIDQLVAMYGLDAVIECGCNGKKPISGAEITSYLLHQTVEHPALGLQDIWLEGDSIALAFRTDGGFVWVFLEFTENGLISRCRCGPMVQASWLH